ncbi:Ephrin [Necator americanus]|uniref:Ephrin n=1 Tax=Necator americanus TaxID=51031 RepID=W2TXT7_NECAM|nr:Ephrin [Necator americanus]ETN86683.1 Ephrin [Necator americanus]
MDIVCPFYDPDVDFMDTEQSIIYRVSKSDYESCTLSSTAKELGRCISPMRRDKVKVSFRLLSPNPSALDYRPGHTYYFITTSTGTPWGLDNTRGGLCSTHQLKMITHVGDYGHHHHHRHHRRPTTTTESPPPEESDWPADPLWTNIFQKVETVGNSIWSTVTRGERLSQRHEYESVPFNDNIDFQIHEIGDVESLFMSSSSVLTSVPLWILLIVAALLRT